jgi:hypothetical protein
MPLLKAHSFVTLSNLRKLTVTLGGTLSFDPDYAKYPLHHQGDEVKGT